MSVGVWERRNQELNIRRSRPSMSDSISHSARLAIAGNQAHSELSGIALCRLDLDSLQQAQAAVLDGLEVVVLLLVTLLVLLLEPLDHLLEASLQRLDLSLLRLDLGLALSRRQGLELLDLGLLRVVSELHIARGAHGAELLGEGVEVLVLS